MNATIFPTDPVHGDLPVRSVLTPAHFTYRRRRAVHRLSFHVGSPLRADALAVRTDGPTGVDPDESGIDAEDLGGDMSVHRIGPDAYVADRGRQSKGAVGLDRYLDIGLARSDVPVS